MLSRAFLQIRVPTVYRRNSRFLTVALVLWIGFGALGQAEAGGVPRVLRRASNPAISSASSSPLMERPWRLRRLSQTMTNS